MPIENVSKALFVIKLKFLIIRLKFTKSFFSAKVSDSMNTDK